MPKKTSIGFTSRPHPLFATVVALGAFLTFLIQPLAARSLLPAFGGAGSVWVTALVFYQVVLAAGYLLAHVLHTRLTIRGQAAALVLLSVGALLTLSVLPKPPSGGGLPAVRLLMSLALSVGPPFLVLAMAGPLVQGWAAGPGDDSSTGRGVYSLYAVSNGGALLALAGYPLVVEPLWGILQQGRVWDGLFALEVVLLAVLARRVWSMGGRTDDRRTPAESDSERPRTLLWLSWAIAGVMVLTSTSGLIGQEIAAIPLLWIVPLSLYLITWCLTFCGLVSPGTAARGGLALAAVALIVLAVDVHVQMGFLFKLGFALTGMTLACFAVHASLYRLRPTKQHLTRFYATVAVGGAIGGILAGVAAIRLFNDWRDLALAYGLVAMLAGRDLVVWLRRSGKVRLTRAPSFWLAGLLAAGCCALFAATGMERAGLLYKHRDFHGLVRVVEEGVGDPARHRLVMYHGATVHGCQFLDPELRGAPTTYFGHRSGAGIAIRTQRVRAGTGQGLNIGVVGLGVGTLAAHLGERDAMRFYELSPVVAELARPAESPGEAGHHFHFLDDSRGEVDVVVGDARLSLKAELAVKTGGNSYDLLVLDAFAGDSVPVHLLTREAFSLFTEHLAETGMIAVHVSSNWLDLVPIVYAWADTERWQALTISSRGTADGPAGCHATWVLLFRDREALRILADECRPLMTQGKIMVQNMQNVSYGNLHPWTDDRSDLLALMRAEIRLRKGIT